MQRMPSKGDSDLPHPLQTTRSFSRYEPSESPTSPRHRSSTGRSSDAGSPVTPQAHDDTSDKSHGDVFDTQDEEEPEQPVDDESEDVVPETFEDLPIEIQSLMERFLESLSLKTQSSSLSIDRLSELYQNFYVHVEGQISTHVAALASRMSRDKSPAPSVSSLNSVSARALARRNARNLERRGTGTQQQMLTATEVNDKRRARRQLDLKKIAMEEAVERGICERVYPRLWQHGGSTDDGERDAKLRSRAAALALVGVDLKELLSTSMTSGRDGPDLSDAAKEEKETVRNQLAEARFNMEQMNVDRHPLGKLKHLTAVHKSIVESLSQMFPSTSSADEILPTLIYVIITSPPDAINVVSNLEFIQRFRCASKLDGEASYCLTNLEAAISFLETVDLSSIRPDELPQGPQKITSPLATPNAEVKDPLYRGLPGASPEIQARERKDDHPSPPLPKHSRRLSTFLASGPKPLETAGGAVISSAEDAFESIHNALDGSFKFLFGRLREKQATKSPIHGSEPAAPRTLEEARKLVSSDESKDDDASFDDTATPDADSTTARENGGRVLELIGGRKGSREHSIASTISDGSGRRGPAINVATGSPTVTTSKGQGMGTQASQTSAISSIPPQLAGYNAVESMRTLGNSLNPLKGFSMRGFGRVPGTTPPPAAEAWAAAPAPETAAHEKQSRIDASGIGQPIQRFVELKDAKELNFFDIELLLRDYQRLAGALKALQS